jgi:peptidyl-prolyl cis-trans isomerase D
MLSTIREKTQGWIAGIILGLIAIPFALWGINYYFEGNGRVDVAVVNGTEISVDTYRRALDDQRRALQQVLGRGADMRLFDTPAFHQRVLDGLIGEILLANDIQAQGYRMSDAELSRQIRTAAQFQRDGQFDPRLYEALLRNAGMDVRGFELRLRRDVLTRQAESGYAASVILTPSDIEAVLRLQAEQREAAVAVLKPARLRDRVKVTSAAAEQEYAAHPERYKSPERVRIEYIRLSAADLASSVHVTDEEVRQAMRDASQTSAVKDERRASHILIKLPAGADAAAEKAAMGKIQGLRAKLKAGADFATLAKQYSEDPGSASQGGDLGFVARGTLAKEFEQALFALKKPGDLSAPVRTSYGLHLIKLTGVKSASSAPTVARSKVEADLKAHKAEERFFGLSEKFNNLVYEQPDSLKPAAEALGLKIETSGWLTRTGSGDGIGAQPKVLEAAFDPDVLEQGRNSNAIEVGTNSLLALRVVAHEPARVRPLNEVRAQIEKALLDAELRSEAQRLAQEAVDKLNTSGSLDRAARQYGMDYRAPRLYGRKASGVEAPLLAALFQAAHPQADKPAYGTAILADGSVAVFALKRIVVPEKVADLGPEAATVRRLLEARRGQEYFDSYRAGLRQQAKIKIYKDQL